MPKPASERLALEGGTAVRTETLPYGRQWIDEGDIEAVVETLRGDWLTTGPTVDRFEEVFAAATGARHAVAVSNGTAALHAAMAAAGVGPGDEVVVPAMTFVATANAVRFCGGTPVFADVDPDTLLVDPEDVAAKTTDRTRAVVGVDYAGLPCDAPALARIARAHDARFVVDAAHSLGGALDGAPVGSLADLSTFSLHPVKHITTGEGGVVTTDEDDLAARMRRFRNHGIATDHRQRAAKGTFAYDMVELGYNYRITDIQCALGIQQLGRLDAWVQRRQEIAARYDRSFQDVREVRPLESRPGASHAYHLYVVRLVLDRLRVDRAAVFQALRAEGIGVNVHYEPVHLHSYYRDTLGTGPGLCPVAEAAYATILSLPMFPRMTDDDVDDTVRAVTKVMAAYGKEDGA